MDDKKLRIILTEDNPDHARIIRESLLERKPDLDICVAPTVRETMNILKVQTCDVIISDYSLPDLTGLDLLQFIQQFYQEIPVVIITASEREDIALEALCGGAMDFVIKPVKLQLLTESLLRLVKRVEMEKDLNQARRELHKILNELEQREKMAKLGLIASNLVHEFRNILSVLSGWAELALVCPEKYQTKLPAMVVEQTSRFTSLMENVSVLGRRDRFPQPWVDLAAVLDDVVELVRHELAKTNIQLILRLDPVPKISLHSPSIQQVFLNLILNAIEAIGTDGSITVAMRPDGEGILTEFADNGPGMSQNVQRDIFKPFFTTKKDSHNQRKGSGLGLYFCREILHGYNGRIEVQSSPGQGTTFRIWLPLKPERAAAAAAEQTAAEPARLPADNPLEGANALS